MCDLPRLRGIKESYAWLKEQDPDTQITLKGYTIMVKTGVIPNVRRGKKYLIDINTLPDNIKRWVESGITKTDTEIIDIPDRHRSRASTERKYGNEKYGQIRSIG